ncbi:5145_t:CDS:2, partial [Gigaspora margarita]
ALTNEKASTNEEVSTNEEAQVRNWKKEITDFIKKNQDLIERTQSLGAKAQHVQVKIIFNPTKNFSSNTIWLATSILQVGQLSLRSTVKCMQLVYEFLVGEPPQNWLSMTTLRTWHRDVSELEFNKQINQLKNALALE